MVNDEPNITLLKHRQFNFKPTDLTTTGRSDNTSITSISVINTSQNDRRETFHGRFFIDASYEGDLIAAAGIETLIGREGRSFKNETGAGKVYKLWEGGECPGTTHKGDRALQSFNYRLCLTKSPHRVPISKPSSYNRSEYLSLIDDVKSGRHGSSHQRVTEAQEALNRARAEENQAPVPNLLPGINRILGIEPLPNAKFDANNQALAFLSTDLPEENWSYLTDAWPARLRYLERLKSYTLGLLHFAQTDSALPAYFREETGKWGLCPDEFVENGNFPRQAYIRVGRRMKGVYQFTSHDATSTQSSHVAGLSIATAHYALDSHAVHKRTHHPSHCQLDGQFQYPTRPYTIPYSILVPASSTSSPTSRTVTNLLAPVPVSASAMGFSTLRMEAAWVGMGEAAGLAAALALEKGVRAADVDVGVLQRELMGRGGVLFVDGEGCLKEGGGREGRTPWEVFGGGAGGGGGGGSKSGSGNGDGDGSSSGSPEPRSSGKPSGSPRVSVKEQYLATDFYLLNNV
ncbi:hypothetical protein K402DRAFT_455479 [Aulographum hederae CBS 113979]|uniref:Uncharacterized protein n=1 Tax=Aulographum hederae CBS 113979 TaxID=1176131 RepID=A0A6G1GV97_9PEZI|nr:hypothetical protein K402DRAFT_455479 [Aulographum hederae CBS 113979]